MSENPKLWGGRFSQDPSPLLRRLNDSIAFDVVLYRQDIQGSIAYAQALARAGIITDAEAQQLTQGLETVLSEFETNTFVIQPSDEDIHTAVERRLSELIGPVAGKLHTGRSRNDQVATDIKLWLQDTIKSIMAQLRDIQLALITQAELHLSDPMPGYTHMQPAQPITIGHWLMSFVAMLQRDVERLEDSQKRLQVLPLGSSALAGTPYPIDQQKLGEALHMPSMPLNSLDEVSNRDHVAEFLFCASLIGVHLSRLAEDVIYYSNPAFGFITLPDAYSTGSSIMPQKRNADPMELARGKAGRMIGNLVGLLTTLKGLPSGYNKDLQEDKEPLFDTVKTLEQLLPVMAGMIAALHFNTERMRAALNDDMLATELADWLVLEKGVPFREAHHLVGRAVKLAEERHIGLSELSISDYQNIDPRFDEGLFYTLNIDVAIQKRRGYGGTSPEALRREIARVKAFLEDASLIPS
ncbi:MAG: argininosuccinate lyase [Phototrophicales bacterium]|nr:MAG: argininosuccinate lyase [Phototrophicales bacterium]